jgi:hypothetical protein
MKTIIHVIKTNALPLLLALGACTIPSDTNDPGIISSLRFEPSAFDSFRQNTVIRYSLSRATQVSIYIVIRDPLGTKLVKTIIENLNETKGSHSHTWLGDNEQGYFAPSGLYYGIVRVNNKPYEAEVRIYHN